MIGSLKLFLPKGHERRPDVGRAICRKAQNVSEPPDQTCRTREEYIMINWACLIGSPTALTEYPNHDRLFQIFLPKGYERGPDGGRSRSSEPPDQSYQTLMSGTFNDRLGMSNGNYSSFRLFY